MTPSPTKALEDLLERIFEANDFRRFIASTTEGETVLADVPETGVSLADMVFRTIQQLDNRGRIDRGLFVALEHERPGQIEAIRGVRDCFFPDIAGDVVHEDVDDPPTVDAPGSESRNLRASTFFPTATMAPGSAPTTFIPDPAEAPPDAHFMEHDTSDQPTGPHTRAPDGTSTAERWEPVCPPELFETHHDPLLVVRGGFDFLCQVRMHLNHRVRVGRTDACDLILTDPSVSRMHGEVFRTNEGTFLKDMGSTLGTWVNGRSVGAAPRLLNAGDRILFGNTLVHFEALDEEDDLNQVRSVYERYARRVHATSAPGTRGEHYLAEVLRVAPQGAMLFRINNHAMLQAQTDRFRRPVAGSVWHAVIKIALLVLPRESSLFVLGPDAFLALLPGASGECAAYHAEALRKAVVEHPWVCFSQLLNVSVSGVFTRPIASYNLGVWLTAAKAEVLRTGGAQWNNRFVEFLWP